MVEVTSESDVSPVTVSVIIPSFNHGRYLGRAAASVRAQTRTDWECIIVDDGSSDSTRQVANQIVEADDRFAYVHQPNRGLSSARNRGLSQSSGRYVQLLDADDEIHPAKFERQVDALSGRPSPGLSITDYECIAAGGDADRAISRLSPRLRNGVDPTLDLIERWEATLSIPVHCFLVERSLFSDRDIRFAEFLSNHEDWHCWVRVFGQTPEIVFVDEVLASYHVRTDSMSRDAARMATGFIRATDNLRRDAADTAIRAALDKRRREIVVLRRRTRVQAARSSVRLRSRLGGISRTFERSRSRGSR